MLTSPIAGATARTPRNGPSSLVRNRFSYSVTLVSSNGFNNRIAALLTSTSISPKRSSVTATSCC